MSTQKFVVEILDRYTFAIVATSERFNTREEAYAKAADLMLGRNKTLYFYRVTSVWVS